MSTTSGVLINTAFLTVNFKSIQYSVYSLIVSVVESMNIITLANAKLIPLFMNVITDGLVPKSDVSMNPLTVLPYCCPLA